MEDVWGSRPCQRVLEEQADGSLLMEYYDTIPPNGEQLVMSSVATRN